MSATANLTVVLNFHFTSLPHPICLRRLQLSSACLGAAEKCPEVVNVSSLVCTATACIQSAPFGETQNNTIVIKCDCNVMLALG